MTHKNNHWIPGNVWEGESKARLNCILYIWYIDKWDLGKYTVTFTFCFIDLSIIWIFSVTVLFYNKNDPYFICIMYQYLLDHLCLAAPNSLHLMLSPFKYECNIFSLLILFFPILFWDKSQTSKTIWNFILSF